MKNLEIIGIAIAITLTTATQLRFSSLPIGIGELFIIIWILGKFVQLMTSKQHLITPILKLVCSFWGVGFTALTYGLLIADTRGLKSSTWPHDYFAFGFAFILSLCLANSHFFYSQLEKLIDYVISSAILSLLIIFLFPSLIPFLTPWMEGVRFQGWSQNSNQLALLLSAIPFWALYLFTKTSQLLSKLKFLFLIVLCFIIGAATQSDALIFGWIIGFAVYLFLELYFFLSKNILFQKSLTSEMKGLVQAIMAVLVAILLLILADFSYQQLYSSASNVYDQGSQGSLRMILWRNGITAISSSPLFGLGPGAHSGSTRPFLDFEAHNTFIDWGCSTGIVGIIAYIYLLGRIAWQAWKIQSFIMVCAVICLIVFSCFHYVLRHPTFWFYLLSINSLSWQISKNKQSYKPKIIKGINR